MLRRSNTGWSADTIAPAVLLAICVLPARNVYAGVVHVDASATGPNDGVGRSGLGGHHGRLRWPRRSDHSERGDDRDSGQFREMRWSGPVR